MLPCVCSVIDHRGRQNVVRTSVTHSAAPRVPLFCSYHILTSSVIYYWTDARQHGIYLLNSDMQCKYLPQLSLILAKFHPQLQHNDTNNSWFIRWDLWFETSQLKVSMKLPTECLSWISWSTPCPHDLRTATKSAYFILRFKWLLQLLFLWSKFTAAIFWIKSFIHWKCKCLVYGLRGWHNITKKYIESCPYQQLVHTISEKRL